MSGRNYSSRIRKILLKTSLAACLFLLVLHSAFIAAGADDSPIVFDDYVGETTAAAEEYSDPGYSENDAFEGAQTEDAAGSSGVSAEEENNNGDDTYISNNGTVFRIPRVKDKNERVFDYRGIFTAEQQQALRDRIAALEQKKKSDIIILIPENVPLDVRNGTETSQK